MRSRPSTRFVASLKKNAGDQGAYFEAVEGKTLPSEAQWGDVLDGLWSETKTLADKLRNFDGVVELGHGQPALPRLDDGPTPWGRKEWIPPSISWKNGWKNFIRGWAS